MRTERATGQWISPDAGWVPLGRWADEWLAAYVGRAASTQAGVRSVMRAHILPRFADRPLISITRFDGGRMVNDLEAARAFNHSWTHIADAVGITRQSAHKRWRHLEEPARALAEERQARSRSSWRPPDATWTPPGPW